MFDVSEAVTFAEHTDGGTRYIVIYKPCGNPARLRFTLAHELGHRVLGHQARELADEREADCFASHLLCPQPVMDYLCREGGKPTAAQLAGLFYVSIPCARAVLRRQRILLENELKEAMQALCGRLVISPVKHPEENAPPKDE
ncbi:MAG: ImmA/IrrE family metallo-endopeptidase [Clostridia bacterium]|nr:ImmA/IrrE family metallo-endopeptidase [Clostridia bacterium]